MKASTSAVVTAAGSVSMKEKDTFTGVLSALIERHLSGPRIDRKPFDVALLWADPWRIERLVWHPT
jgi:hypothetical protein